MRMYIRQRLTETLATMNIFTARVLDANHFSGNAVTGVTQSFENQFFLMEL